MRSRLRQRARELGLSPRAALQRMHFATLPVAQQPAPVPGVLANWTSWQRSVTVSPAPGAAPLSFTRLESWTIWNPRTLTGVSGTVGGLAWAGEDCAWLAAPPPGLSGNVALVSLSAFPMPPQGWGGGEEEGGARPGAANCSYYNILKAAKLAGAKGAVVAAPPGQPLAASWRAALCCAAVLCWQRAGSHCCCCCQCSDF